MFRDMSLSLLFPPELSEGGRGKKKGREEPSTHVVRYYTDERMRSRYRVNGRLIRLKDQMGLEKKKEAG